MRKGRDPVDSFLAEIKASGMIPVGGAILELGTGRCYDHWALFEEEYTVIPSDRYIQECPEVYPLDAQDFISCPGLFSQYPDFDAILAIELLEHCPDPLKVLVECHSHLKMNGIAVMTMPFYYQIHEGMVTGADFVGDYWRFTPRGMGLLFHRAGFQRWFTRGGYNAGDTQYQPSYTLGWAQKCEGEPAEIQEWHIDLPDDWREGLLAAEARWRERHGEAE